MNFIKNIEFNGNSYPLRENINKVYVIDFKDIEEFVNLNINKFYLSTNENGDTIPLTLCFVEDENNYSVKSVNNKYINIKSDIYPDLWFNGSNYDLCMDNALSLAHKEKKEVYLIGNYTFTKTFTLQPLTKIIGKKISDEYSSENYGCFISCNNVLFEIEENNSAGIYLKNIKFNSNNNSLINLNGNNVIGMKIENCGFENCNDIVYNGSLQASYIHDLMGQNSSLTNSSITFIDSNIYNNIFTINTTQKNKNAWLNNANIVLTNIYNNYITGSTKKTLAPDYLLNIVAGQDFNFYGNIFDYCAKSLLNFNGTTQNLIKNFNIFANTFRGYVDNAINLVKYTRDINITNNNFELPHISEWTNVKKLISINTENYFTKFINPNTEYYEDYEIENHSSTTTIIDNNRTNIKWNNAILSIGKITIAKNSPYTGSFNLDLSDLYNSYTQIFSRSAKTTTGKYINCFMTYDNTSKKVYYTLISENDINNEEVTLYANYMQKFIFELTN